MKLGNISANEVLAVGGVLAAAYVVYQLSGAVSSVSDGVKNLGKQISDAYDSTVGAVSGAVDSTVSTVKNGVNAISETSSSIASDAMSGKINPFALGPVGILLGGTASVAQGAYDKINSANSAKVGATKYDASTQVGNAPSFAILSQDPVTAYSNPAANPIWASDGMTITSPNGGLIFK